MNLLVATAAYRQCITAPIGRGLFCSVAGATTRGGVVALMETDDERKAQDFIKALAEEILEHPRSLAALGQSSPQAAQRSRGRAMRAIDQDLRAAVSAEVDELLANTIGPQLHAPGIVASE